MQGTVHRTWVQAQSLLGPVFEGISAKHQHLTLLQQVRKRCMGGNAFVQNPCMTLLNSHLMSNETYVYIYIAFSLHVYIQK